MKNLNFFSKKDSKAESPQGGRTGASVQELENSNELLMEQLSKVSQDLANARMGKQEAEQTNQSLSKKNDEMKEKVKSLEAQLKKISQTFAYEEAQKTNQKVKELEKSLEEQATMVNQLEVELQDSKTRAADLEENVTQANEERSKLRNQIYEQQDELRVKDETLNGLRNQCAEQTAEVKELQEKMRHEQESIAEETRRKTLEVETKCDERVKAAEKKMHILEAERNSYMQKCKTLQKELQKLLKKFNANEIKELKKENESLRAELERRSKSLTDALSALDTFMSGNVGQRGAKNREAAQGNHQFFALQNEVKKLKSQLNQAEVKLQEKEMVIAQLKSATHFFGEKIIELEDRSKSSRSQNASPPLPSISPVVPVPISPTPNSSDKSKQPKQEPEKQKDPGNPSRNNTSYCEETDLP
uniref:Uncharacterized protein n=1 Tax=Lotharella globosa TaxID=91324 RepID=A0A6U3BU09_9EUKA|mmetsp:Transcript_562/g.1074  ORF Transcript_562/g.1074 Transcript_562/m.1074 type:complete len:417 (-) Transcript_562:397-1647(-)